MKASKQKENWSESIPNTLKKVKYRQLHWFDGISLGSTIKILNDVVTVAILSCHYRNISRKFIIDIRTETLHCFGMHIECYFEYVKYVYFVTKIQMSRPHYLIGIKLITITILMMIASSQVLWFDAFTMVQ